MKKYGKLFFVSTAMMRSALIYHGAKWSCL